MIRFSFLAIIVLTLTLIPKAYSDSIDEEVLSGLNDIYNLDFNSASSKFKKLQANYPDDLRGYFFESMLYFYEALPSRKEEPFRKFMDLSEEIIEKADKRLSKNENDLDAIYFKGMSHSYRSLLLLSLNRDLLEAASDGNSGYRLLNDLISKRPDYYDAYMGLGLYNIALGFVPDKFKWLLALIGFEGNIGNGVEMLNKSMRNGRYTRVDSKVFLCIFSINERELADNKPVEISKQLVEDFPESPVFKIFLSAMLLQSGMPEDAIRYSQEALQQNNGSMQEHIVKSSGAILGNAYFRLNDFENAIINLEKFLSLASPDDRYNVHMFTLGVTYEFLGNRQKALEAYKKVRPDYAEERDGEVEKIFHRYAQERLKDELREYDKELVMAMNLRESGKYEQAMEAYGKMLSSGKHLKSGTDDDKIRLFYNMGLTLNYMNQPKRSVEYLNLCRSLEPETEKWLVPHAYFELGKIYRETGDLKRSEEMFEMIEEFDNFDFESFLQMRLANYLSKNKA